MSRGSGSFRWTDAGPFWALKTGAALPAVAFAPLVQLFRQGEEVNRGE
jgi:hypothetical protein